MKRILAIIVAGIMFLFFCTALGIWLWIDVAVKKNIDIAMEKYPGTAEDALVAYLLDTTNTPNERTHIAIWTLGQIQSEKAVPILEGLYINDPEGKTCYGNHDRVLCQYGIYKALLACESNWWPLHARLKRYRSKQTDVF